ncbi:Retrovirus-related Pol polyprotein LINE-1 [Zea mays]|uniref:Retrovirus-related Pol polyprotein LINE-1 n=1 Tax=Zea mays TaxID=4577 RepID=A0A1D6FKL1_MAIZE|nr:Retrovirus-related Pol polyprotein LINE-1 [Zea mays]
MTTSALMAVDVWSALQHTSFLYMGRLLEGFGVGVISYVVPVYIAEISPQNMRGALGAVNPLSATFGVMFVYVLGLFFPWRLLALIGTLPCLFLIPGLFFIPESPRWLARMNRMDDCETSLQVLRGFNADITAEANDIKIAVTSANKSGTISFQELNQKKNRTPLILGIGLLVLQQLSGINCIVFYSGSIFKAADEGILFNGGNESSTIELDEPFDDNNRGFVRRIQEYEVKEALKRMKVGKAMGPDGIPIEVWRCLGDIAIVWLTKLFNTIFRTNRMPDEWRRSTLVPIFKNKGDVQSCTNYRGIKLMSHTMKLWERVIEHRLRKMTSVTQNQFGFMPGRSTMEAIFLLRQLMERFREQKKDLHMVFIDLEKAYDKVPRSVMWWALEKHKVATKYINLIKDMYSNVVTSVRTSDGDTDDFPINIGLHQGSALSPYLFALVIDEIYRGVCFLPMMWYLLRRVGVVFRKSWNCGGRRWKQKVLGLVGLKRSI